jgi:hypothetical protein
MVDRILRLSHRVGPTPAYQHVRAIRCREMLAPGGTNRNVHLQIAHQSLYSNYIGYCAALKVTTPWFNDASRNNKLERSSYGKAYSMINYYYWIIWIV